jgi:hypothetical protein
MEHPSKKAIKSIGYMEHAYGFYVVINYFLNGDSLRNNKKHIMITELLRR